MVTEAEYLDQQSKRIKARLRHSVREIGREAIEPLDMKPRIRRHPWISLGAAVGTGLLSGLGIAAAVRASRQKRSERSETQQKTRFERVQKHSLRLMQKLFTTAVIASLRPDPPTSSPQEAVEPSDVADAGVL